MKKIFKYVLILIALSALLLLIKQLFVDNTPETETKVISKHLVEGKSDSTYTRGKDSIIIKTKSFHKDEIVKPGKQVSSFVIADSTENYNLKIWVKTFHPLDSIDIKYFLSIKAKEALRIDTLKITRIDTLKIEKLKVMKLKNPFYNTFWFGAAVAGLMILLISIIT